MLPWGTCTWSSTWRRSLTLMPSTTGNASGICALRTTTSSNVSGAPTTGWYTRVPAPVGNVRTRLVRTGASRRRDRSRDIAILHPRRRVHRGLTGERDRSEVSRAAVAIRRETPTATRETSSRSTHTGSPPREALAGSGRSASLRGRRQCARRQVEPLDACGLTDGLEERWGGWRPNLARFPSCFRACDVLQGMGHLWCRYSTSVSVQS